METTKKTNAAMTILAAVALLGVAVPAAAESMASIPHLESEAYRGGIPGGGSIEVESVAGFKQLSKEWKSLREQRATGLQTTLGWNRLGSLGLAADVLVSEANDRGPGHLVRVMTFEYAVGLRYRVGQGRVRGVAGAGVARMDSQLTNALGGFKLIRMWESGPGLWASAGVRFAVRQRLELGADARWSTSRGVDSDRRMAPAGGLLVTATTSWRFGKAI